MRFIFWISILLPFIAKAQSGICFTSVNDINFATDVSPYSVAYGDFNSDGISDIVSANFNPGTISILIGNNTGGYGTPVNYSVGINPSSVISSDFNNDGFDDIAVGFNGMTRMSILFGNGSGVFNGTVTHYNIPFADATYLLLKDVNNDAIKDIICVGYSSSSVAVFLGNNIGIFTNNGSFYIGYQPYSVTSGDFNNDGVIDLAAANSGGNDVSLLIGNGSGSFSPAVSFSVGARPMSIASADFNSDGKADLVTANATYGTLSILLGTGTGSFSPNTTFTIHPSAQTVVSGDFNNDGKFDIACASLNGPVTIVLGYGNGTFSSAVNYPVGPDPRTIITGDIDHDGYADILTANLNSNNVSVLKGNGSGTFFNLDFNVGSYPNAVITADFNNDGNNDIATANMLGNSISTLLGDGLGNFLPAINYSIGINPNSLASGDFNMDGSSDLAVVNMSSNNINILLSAGNGSFTAGSTYTLNSSPTYIYSDNLNNDAFIDLAVIEGGAITIYSGTGTGTFVRQQSYAGHNSPNYIIGTDLNNDSFTDLAVANGVSNDVIILMGGAGGIFTAGTTTLTSGYNTKSVCSGDFNNDGFKDIAVSSCSSIYSTLVYFGNGAGGFFGGMGLPMSANGCFLSSGDYDNDGYSDISVVNVGNVLIYRSDRQGSFYNPEIFPIRNSPSSISMADFNNDGKNDLVVSNQASNNVTVLLNNSAYLSYFGPTSFCLGGSLTLSVTPGASSYSWNPGGILTNTYAATNSGIYNVNVLTPMGVCATNNVTITVNQPTLTVNSGTVCPGQTFPIVPGGAVSYTCTGNSFVVYPTSSTDYTVTGTDANGCVDANGVVCHVTVDPNIPFLSVNSGSICSSQTFTINPSGATTYTYSSGSNTVAPSVNSTYTVTGTDLNGCKNLIGAISTVSVNQLPTITASQNASVCVGTSTLLNASGASTYSWTTGATSPSITITPTISTTYTVTGTDLNNCTNTQTVAVNVNQTCQDVWPGDANSDGLVDNTDVLELGLHFTQTGPARSITSNSWQSYFSNNWTGTITNGKNVNHSDCNGDGTINNSDTLAIYNNYGLTHTFKQNENTATNPQISIIPDQSFVNKGAWGTASIFLGEASTPVTNINGLAYTVTFDQALLETNSIYLEYPTSFINAGNQNLKFNKLNFSNGMLYTATTHTVSGNVSGNGKIAVLHYKIKSSLATDAVLNIGVTQAKQSNAAGALIPLTTGSATVAAIGTSVGIDEFSGENTIGVYPNPANSIVTIYSSAILEKIELCGITGQVILSEKTSENQYQLDLSGVANGVYFVTITSQDKKVQRKKVVVQH